MLSYQERICEEQTTLEIICQDGPHFDLVLRSFFETYTKLFSMPPRKCILSSASVADDNHSASLTARFLAGEYVHERYNISR